LILQLGVILNTVPAWKRAYKLRVAVFVEYESDVEEERSRVKALLENLRIEAEVLVFWLASGDLKTYEIIINGANPGQEAEEEVEQCLAEQSWWDEMQKLRGKRGAQAASENLSDLASIFTARTTWPESSFQQGPRGERVERFLGLRRLLKKSKRRHTASGIAKLGVNLGMRTHSLSQQVANRHASIASASEDSASDSDDESDSEVVADDNSNAETDSLGGAASEADMDDYESESEPMSVTQRRPVLRRKSHGDSMGGPPPSKKSTGEKEVKVPEPPTLRASITESRVATPIKRQSALNVGNLLETTAEASGSQPVNPKELHQVSSPHETTKSSAISQPSLIRRPDTYSRHTSMPKFSSKPVPETRVSTEDGPGPSIMFSDTPTPVTKRSRLPSAYHTSSSMPDHTSEASEPQSPSQSRRGSTYSTQALPLSFNDLPSRAQHLILNELMTSQSEETAVMFTTLPAPVEGTCKSEAASAGYLGDLEVLCKGCPPVLMVHSNSMTVTMSL
jgi:solute carrier family 12 (potassium/chloride transporters), member 9